MARTLGRTVEELSQTISPGEFIAQWELYRQNPWGEIRDDLNTGRIMQSVVAPYQKKDTKLPDMWDLILFRSDQEPDPEPEEEENPLEHFGNLNNGK